MSDANSNENQLKQVDSLVANEFVVELDGEALEGIFGVQGLVSFNTAAAEGTFVISKMVQRDPNNPINRWVRETTNATRPTRTVTVVAVDDGVETRRWAAKDAWISRIAYSDFNAGSGELVEEYITIQYSAIEESWPLLSE
jgi:hypothetical protein